MDIAIVVAAFNRPESLNRLLASISQAEYNGDRITLVISIDYQDSDRHAETVAIAKNFSWKYGEKKIIEHQENLGLKKHILSCGCLTSTYPAIIMLEDDLFVSKQYYNYTKQMLDKYASDEHVAGISLYSPAWVSIFGKPGRPFIPESSKYDVYFVQCAQSWGQCWTAGMWDNFYEWFLNHDMKLFPEPEIPAEVTYWPESSWLKYYIGYVVKTNKYFVFPYISLTTNFGDVGMHTDNVNSSGQVPLQNGEMQYRMSEFSDAVKYDVFYERIDLPAFPEIPPTDICIDLYGAKHNNMKKRYWLTMDRAPYKIAGSYGLYLRPHENNVVFNIQGNDIFLYDTHEQVQLPKKDNSEMTKLFYDYKIIPYRNSLKIFLYNLKGGFIHYIRERMK